MRKKWLWRTLAVIAGLVVVTVLVFTLSPWPSALIIRQVFQDGAKKTAAIMAPYAPTSGVDSVFDVQYATDSTQPHVKASDFTQLDVFYPTGTTTQLGTVIWTHGGAWISGN